VAVVVGVIAVLGAGVLLVGRSGPGPDDSPRVGTARRPAPATPTGDAQVATTPSTASTEIAPETAAAETAAQVVPEAPSPPATWADAQAAWDSGEWSVAAARFAGYAAAHEGNPWGWFMTGLALRQDGRFPEAEAALERCLEIDADHGKALVALARVRLSMDDPADALAPIEAAVARDPESVDAQRVLGRVLHTLGRRDEAEAAYVTALSIDPDDAWSNNNLGLLRIEGERFSEALEPLERACAAGPEQAVFFNNLGVALERTGRYRAAEQAYAHAVVLEPGSKASASLARVSGLGGEVDEPAGVLAASPAAEVAAGPER